MVDAQHAGVAHVGAVDRVERGPAVARAGERIERRQAPVLPLGGERIRRRADRDASREFRGVRPGFGAVRRGADGKIAIEPDLQAALARALRGSPELAVGQPLAEEGELEGLAAPLDRAPRSPSLPRRASLAATGASPRRLLPPRSPGRRRSAAKPRRPKSRICGSRRPADRPAARRRARAERCAPGFQRRALGAPDGVILDMLGRGSGGESGRRRRQRGAQRLVARQARVVERVDENRIEEAAIRGIIGARAVPLVAGTACAAGSRRNRPPPRRRPSRPRAPASRSRRSPGRHDPHPCAAGRRAGRRRQTACGRAAFGPSASGGAIVSAHSTPSTMSR